MLLSKMQNFTPCHSSSLISSLLLATAFANSLYPSESKNYTIAPVAIFHGVLDNCETEGEWMRGICAAVGDQAPACKCVEIGNGKKDSAFKTIDWQAQQGCLSLKTDPDFAFQEINIIGLSQGGIIVRTIVERCHGLNVHTLFTYGAPQNGVADLFGEQHWKDVVFSHLLAFNIVANHFTPAQTYRTWWDPEFYEKHNHFLPYLNNEFEDYFEQDLKDNMMALTNFGMWIWQDDHTITPKESGWWAQQNTTGDLVYLRDLDMYAGDWIGLRTLDEAGKLFFYSGPGKHLEYHENYVTDYLMPLLTDGTPATSEY